MAFLFFIQKSCSVHKTKALLFFFFILIFQKGFTQDNYDSLVEKGDSLKKIGQYKAAIPYYETAFKSHLASEFDYYSLARCYGSLSHKKPAIDILVKLFALKFEHLSKIPGDSAFVSLHKMKQWEKLIQKIFRYQDLLIKHRDTALISTLSAMHRSDQEYRSVLDSLFRNGSTNKMLIGEISYKIETGDSINIKNLVNIIKQKGWPGIDKAGNEGNLAAYLILQHSGIQVQKKYIRLVELSVKQGFTPRYLYAYLIDRILLGEGKPQQYGTQLDLNPKTGKYEVMLLESAEKVNELRRAMGLPALQSYIDIINKK